MAGKYGKDGMKGTAGGCYNDNPKAGGKNSQRAGKGTKSKGVYS